MILEMNIILYIRDLGVNLRIAELQEELGKIDVDQYKTKENNAVNIAFVEKIAPVRIPCRNTMTPSM